ncbi:MAG: peroxiredoxin [Hydrogenophilaceae bacterium]|nr:peroxiredoxin [Hydrogenophilaceae bacterium]
MKLLLLLVLLAVLWTVWRGVNTAVMPLAGSRAPDFRLPDQDGKFHQLSAYAGKWRIVYFYPRDDTPGCTKEACAFRDGLEKLQAAGAVVLGISVDGVARHKRFAEKYHLNFPLLADPHGAVSRQYGVLMDWVILRMAKRVTFLIGPDGTISHVYRQVDPDRHDEAILKTIESLKSG